MQPSCNIAGSEASTHKLLCQYPPAHSNGKPTRWPLQQQLEPSFGVFYLSLPASRGAPQAVPEGDRTRCFSLERCPKVPCIRYCMAFAPGQRLPHSNEAQVPHPVLLGSDACVFVCRTSDQVRSVQSITMDRFLA